MDNSPAKGLPSRNEVKAGYKKTEIGVIPEDWEVERLDKTSTLKARIGWQGLTTAEYLDSGNYYLVTGTDFDNGKIKWETCHFVKKVRYTQDKNIQLKQEDILITKDGTIGKIAFIDDVVLPATLNSGVFVVRAKKNSYIAKFVFYIFNSIYFVNFLNELIAGSTINHLYQKDFVNFKIPLPSLSEQKAVATVLSDTDNLIQALEKKIAKKQLIKKGTMQQLLSPKERWVRNTLGEVFKFKQGIQCAVENQSKELKEGLIRFIRIIDLSQEGEAPRYIKDPGINYHINKTDLFMVRYGTPGLLGFGYEGVIANNLFVLKPINNISQLFFFHLLSFKKEEILELSSSTTMAAINFTSLKALKIIYPKSIQEQTRIAQILLDMDAEIEALEKKLAKYKQLKQGLMQNLLTGKIRLI